MRYNMFSIERVCLPEHEFHTEICLVDVSQVEIRGRGGDARHVCVEICSPRNTTVTS